MPIVFINEDIVFWTLVDAGRGKRLHDDRWASVVASLWYWTTGAYSVRIGRTSTTSTSDEIGLSEIFRLGLRYPGPKLWAAGVDEDLSEGNSSKIEVAANEKRESRNFDVYCDSWWWRKSRANCYRDGKCSGSGLRICLVERVSDMQCATEGRNWKMRGESRGTVRGRCYLEQIRCIRMCHNHQCQYRCGWVMQCLCALRKGCWRLSSSGRFSYLVY